MHIYSMHKCIPSNPAYVNLQTLLQLPNSNNCSTTTPINLANKMQVLLLGGHGKVALHLTPLLLSRGWNVTSVIRNPEHENEILALGKGQKGKLDVLISSLDDVKSVEDARGLVDRVRPECVVWAAGMFIHSSSWDTL